MRLLMMLLGVVFTRKPKRIVVPVFIYSIETPIKQNSHKTPAFFLEMRREWDDQRRRKAEYEIWKENCRQVFRAA